MGPAVFFEEAAIAHRDACRAGHEVVSIFDATVAEGIGKFFVGVAIDAIEFDEPGFEAVGQRDLARADFVSGGIPGHDGFGAGSSGGCSYAEDVGESVFFVSRNEGGAELVSIGENGVGEID